jgi:hypothetical protein
MPAKNGAIYFDTKQVKKLYAMFCRHNKRINYLHDHACISKYCSCIFGALTDRVLKY